MTTMKCLRVGIFLAIKDIFSNISSLLFVSAALGFLFANVLFSRFMLYGFEVCIGNLVPKVSGQVYLSPLRGSPYIYNTQELEEAVSENPLLAASSPVLEMPCVLDYKDSRIVTVVWGVNLNETVMDLKGHIVEGRYFSDPHGKQIILGKILKRRFEQKIPLGQKIAMGDVIEAIFIKEHNVDKFNKEVYRDQYCTVVGVVDFKDYIANNSIFMPLEGLRDTVLLYDRSSYLFMRLNNGSHLGPAVTQEFSVPPQDADVKYWKDRDDYGTDDLVYGFNIISAVIFVVSIICAAILVAFVIFYNTQKKRRETGILRAIGIRSRVFFILFILEGIFFSIMGVIVGSAIYYGLELFMRRHPVVMPFGDLFPIYEPKSYIFAIELFIAVAFIASIYYAIKGSKENIIKIMRGD